MRGKRYYERVMEKESRKERPLQVDQSHWAKDPKIGNGRKERRNTEGTDGTCYRNQTDERDLICLPGQGHVES